MVSNKVSLQNQLQNSRTRNPKDSNETFDHVLPSSLNLGWILISFISFDLLSGRAEGIGLQCNLSIYSLLWTGVTLLLCHTDTHTHTSIWITKRKNELIDADRTLSSDPLEGYLSAAPPSFAFPSPYFRQCNNIILRKVLALLTDLMKAPCVHACMLLLWSSTD